MLNSINVVSIRAFEELALKGSNIENINSPKSDGLDFYISKSEVEPTSLKQAITDQLKLRDDQYLKNAASLIIDLMDDAQGSIDSMVSKVRAVRRTESQLVSRIKLLDQAKSYGAETTNYLPLMILLGHVDPSKVENKALTVIPEGWTPKESNSDHKAA